VPATPCKIEQLAVSAYEIPTATPEADGTFEWYATTLVVVEAAAGGQVGLGFTYAHRAAGVIIEETLQPLVCGKSAFDVGGVWTEMTRAVRNLGQPGICRMAISAVDTALWDLKARILGIPLVSLLGAVRESMPLYGSGGFTNYSAAEMRSQFETWLAEGITSVKMKIGRDAVADRARVEAAREIIDRSRKLFVDANGAYTRKEALAQAEIFAEQEVSWFEEPVSSDDLEGLRLLRDRASGGMQIAAGEYGFEADYFRRMLMAGAVDVLQADATRCGGYTGFLQASALCEAFHLPLSAHCAPALHLPVGCACPPFCHAEYFFDHARIEQRYFDGSASVKDGVLRPDLSSPGHGLRFKRADAERYAV
jgi:L-alanine-DL-glutamate epimerase-like enolase superfamily enzyme